MSFIPTLAEEIDKAIKKNYLIVLLISSHTQAKHKAVNLPYGLGKSTLWLGLMKLLTGSWDDAFARIAYNPLDFYKLIERGKVKRHAAVGWDDVQLTAPAEKSVPTYITKVANKVSVARPEVAVVVMTAPNINSISAPLRRIVTHELIVYERGHYEGQRYVYLKNYKDPKIDLCKMYPCGIGDFPQLTPELEERYDKWRAQEKMRISKGDERSITNACHLYDIPEDGTHQKTTLKGTVVRSGGSWFVRLPPEVGERLNKKEVDVTAEM